MLKETNGREQPVPDEGTQLFSEFPASTYEEWRQAAEKTLKGASFEKRLITKTYEGIDLQPLYFQEHAESLPHMGSLPGVAPFVRSANAAGYVVSSWNVAQEIPYGTPEELNQALHADMQRGQTAVNLVPDPATLAGKDADQAEAGHVGVGGTSISTVSDLIKVFEGIDLEKTPIFIQAGSVAFPLAAALVAVARHHGEALDKIEGCVGMDPLGALAHEGTLPRSLESAYDMMAQLTTWAESNAPQLRTIAVQAQPYHDGGANAVQELAFAIATGVEYLREMQQRGLTVDTAAPRMLFGFSLGSNFFMEIAKLRAARLLWAQVVQAFDGSEDAQKMVTHVRTSAYNKTVYDPYVNMLRTTTEAFAGVLGGCNSMHVGSFDEIKQPPDTFSRRIARNTQLVLEQECNLARPIDPAGGSWYIETLTDELARSAWALFQEVEQNGGMFKALQAEFPQQQVAKVAEQRAKAIATRKDVFVGTNMYPNLIEKPLADHQVDAEALRSQRAADVETYRAGVDQSKRNTALQAFKDGNGNLVDAAVTAMLAGATLGELTTTLRTGDEATPTITPVRIHRATDMFETLRANAEAYAAKTGSRPQVFLANMGPIPKHKPRADFSTGFFEVGGFKVLTNAGFATPEEAAQAALDSGAPVVVICSTDDNYPEAVPPLTKQIKDAKPDTTVLLAGYPADQIEAHKQAGVDEFIHVRANCYEILHNLQQKIGVA